MKKFLLTALLIAAVVTSLTAGSLAAYVSTLDVNTRLFARTFKITASKGGTFTEQVRFAPGDFAWYMITVSNDGETAAKINATATLDGVLKNAVALSFYNAERSEIGSNFSEVELPSGDSYTFYVRAEWPYSTSDEANSRDNSLIGKSSLLNVNINSISANKGTNFG